jgi:hypothetical protein
MISQQASQGQGGGPVQLLTDPLFYGNSSLPKGQPSNCAFSAEDFLQRMNGVRLNYHKGDDTAAIDRATSNFRGNAVTWWRALVALKSRDGSVPSFTTSWVDFARVFRSQFFAKRNRWDSCAAYLLLKPSPGELATEFAYKILDAHRDDIDRVHADVQQRLDATTPDENLVARIREGGADAVTTLNTILKNRDKMHHMIEMDVRSATEVTRAMAFAWPVDSLKRAIAEQGQDGLSFEDLINLILIKNEASAKLKAPVSAIDAIITESTEDTDGDSGGANTPLSEVAALRAELDAIKKKLPNKKKQKKPANGNNSSGRGQRRGNTRSSGSARPGLSCPCTGPRT